MSFREKTCWVMLVTLIAGAVFYFDHMISYSQQIGEVSPPKLGLIIVYIIFIVITSGGVMAVLAGLNPEEAESDLDERERQIANKAGNYAGTVLAIGICSAMVHFAMNGSGNLFFHLVLGSLMLSHAASCVIQIWLYRWGV